jgi:UDP-N-acetylmuramate--alanine ligase
LFREKQPRIHFVGIGGIGMSGIAELLLNLGYPVSGSDLKESESLDRLASLGARVSIGHRAENVASADVVVVSSAVRRDNVEIAAARAAKVPVIPRAEMLAELMRLKSGIAVAGSHGKTTTTSLIAHVLASAGLDPTLVVGGRVGTFGAVGSNGALGANAKLGKGDWMVVEADESDGTFLRFSQTIAVVSNIDAEHLDHYGDLSRLRAAFVEFINRVPFYGLAVVCLDHPVVRDLLPEIEKRAVTYGFSDQADYRATDLKLDGFTSSFEAVVPGPGGPERLGRFELPMVGSHNVQNALAALAVADELSIPRDTVRKAFATFRGVDRRFSVRGDAAGVLVVDDYGHHPAEIRATLAGARAAFKRRLVVVFQPHRYTRTRDLFEDFTEAFSDADLVIVTDIYAASEDPLPGVSGASLVEGIRRQGHPEVLFASGRGQAIELLMGRLRPGDLALTLGAGDITKLAPELVRALEQRGTP